MNTLKSFRIYNFLKPLSPPPPFTPYYFYFKGSAGKVAVTDCIPPHPPPLHLTRNFIEFFTMLECMVETHTQGGGFFLLLPLLYGIATSSAECQHPEAWPFSIYGNL